MSFPGDGDADGRKPSPGSRDRLKERLEELDRRLASQGGKREGLSEEEQKRRSTALGIAMRLATELLVGVFGGGLIGWLLDRWLGTLPLFLVVFLLLGMAAGILNAVRGAREMSGK